MAMNRVQFQAGMSLLDFHKNFGTEQQCADALEHARWPNGFHCPYCQNEKYYMLLGRKHKTYQCAACRRQTSIIAGTLFQSTHLLLKIWFLAIYLISEAKTGISSLALKRQLGVSYPTAWLIQHKLMQAMTERDERYTLHGTVQVDDAYLGGERSGGKVGRGSENKVPFVAAVEINENNHPLYIKLSPVSGFTLNAISDWAKNNLSAECSVISDGLSCFNAVKDAGCMHKVFVVGSKKPKELPEFNWINTILGNVKTSLSGAYHSFKFIKYAKRYLGTIAYRFNRRFNLDLLPQRLLFSAISCKPHSESWLRVAS